MYENHVGLPLSQTHARPARESEGLSPDSHEQAVAGGDPSDEDCAARAARKMIKALRSGKRNTTNAKICSTLPGALSRSRSIPHHQGGLSPCALRSFTRTASSPAVLGLALSQTHARPARESKGLSPDSHEQAVAGDDPSDEDCAAREARKMIT